MDDTLEPTATANGDNGDNPDENETNEEALDDDVLDWTKLLPSASRPVIPKRGEKDFEPRAQQGAQDQDGGGSFLGLTPAAAFTGTALQQHLLDRARKAMFDALRATRTISSKNISYGIWYPNLSRTHVTLARGTHFTTIGHSAPRFVCGDGDDPENNACDDATSKVQKRLELLPEETIYLVERGSMLCWKAGMPFGSPKIESTMFGGVIPGAPMSVQQVYAEMIGRERLTLEKLQVYTYLKRLGYIVTRAEPPDPYYPIPAPPFAITPQKPSSILQRLWSFYSGFISRLVQLINVRDWWHPVKLNRWRSRCKNYPFIFRSLRFIPSDHKLSLHRQPQDRTPYKIFYNVYKPNTPFKRTSPGKPDFQVVVVDARTTPMPTLHELANLFDQVPEVPPPAAQRKTTINPIQEKKTSPPSEPSTPPNAVPLPSSLFRWLLLLFVQQWCSPSRPKADNANLSQKSINPFASLKMGKRIVVIATVDCGNISFFRFGQGCFEEWPMA